MRRVFLAAAMVSLCLSGCATDKSFEKEILGHQAPESPTDTGWSRTQAPPPPPPPIAYAPPPAPVPPAPRPPVASIPPATEPRGGTHGAAEEPAAPNLFTPPQAATPAPVQPAVLPPAPVKTPAKPAKPVSAGVTVMEGGSTLFTFQVGEFAHTQTANTLMATLKGRGFGVRMEQGKRNAKTFYKVFASKAGSRAALEGELLTLGVLEPRLTEERPAASPSGAAHQTPATAPAPEAVPAPRKTAVTPVPSTKKISGAVAPAPKTSGSVKTIAPPVVEPAPPLPDGYVPPPPKNGS